MAVAPHVLLTESDTYLLRRALAGLPWQNLGLTINPWVELLIQNLGHDVHDIKLLTHVLGLEVISELLKCDPNAAPPSPQPFANGYATSLDHDIPIPALPTEVEQFLHPLEKSGWLADCLHWMCATANETPYLFHLGAALALAATAIGRRLYVATPWGEKVYPNLYVMIIAVSTYYRKTSGLRLAEQILHQSIPHMLLPEPGSPESFMNMLAGTMPFNFEALPKSEQEFLQKASLFAAARLIIRDELSGLFKAMGRDYMAGMKELIMQLYDCPPMQRKWTNSRGMVVVRDAALSIIGAATPAGLAEALSTSDWHSGNLARFMLLTPEPDYAERPASVQALPSSIPAQLRHLHEWLPRPTADPAVESESWSLVFRPWKELTAYEQTLRRMTHPDSGLDDRLRGVYGRLHVQAIKVATILAALESETGKPVIEARHIGQGLFVTELLRASAHRALATLGSSEEIKYENRILQLLAKNPQGLTERDIYRQLHMKRTDAGAALDALETDGKLQRRSKAPTKAGGRSTEIFTLVEE